METSPSSTPSEKIDHRIRSDLSRVTGGQGGKQASLPENALGQLLFEVGVEPSMTVHEAAAILRWSYWKARRYFSHVEGICLSYRPKRYKRPYRTFTIPLSIFTREWQKMTGHEPESADVIRRRLALTIQK